MMCDADPERVFGYAKALDGAGLGRRSMLDVPPRHALGGSGRLGTPRARRLALSSRLTLQAANAWPDPAARAALARGLRRGDRGQLEPAYFGSDGPLQCAAFLTASRQHGNSTAACAPG